MEEDSSLLPENLRCNRTDGKQWRCNRRVVDGLKLCETHHLQGRHRQYKKKVPDSLKLKRKQNRKMARNPDSGALRPGVTGIRVTKAVKMKRRRSGGVSEALDKALKTMKLRKGDLQLDLIRTFLQRQMERRRSRELEEEGRDGDRELTRDLPNGTMAISSSSSSRQIGNAGSCEVKLGVVSPSPVTRRCFRSKNIEPLPVGSMQVVPYAKDVADLRRNKRKRCHWCQKITLRNFVKCSSCKKEFFCNQCIKERYLVTEEEVRLACPVCRQACSCKTCLLDQSKDVE